MSISIPSENEVLNQALTYFRLQFPLEDLSTNSFLGLIARIFASEITALNESVLAADNESPPNAKTTSVGLDNWAFTFGVPNGSGGYGRRGAIPASGGSAQITGVTGTVFSTGLTAVDSTGQIIVQLDQNVFLSPAPLTSAVGTFSALVAGSASNLPVESVLTWQSPPVGADATFTLQTALVGGEDIESDSELLQRILFRIQNPPKGGTAADYRFWAEESVNSQGVSNGIIRAYVYPNKSGTGSVDVIPTQAGIGPGRIPGSSKVTQIQNFIDKLRPVTAKVYVRANSMVQMPANKALSIVIKAIPNLPKYNFTWFDSGNIGTRVLNYNSGARVLTFNTTPTDLVTQITNGMASQVFPTISYYARGPNSTNPLPYILTVIASLGANQFRVRETTLDNVPLDFTLDRINAASPLTIPVLTSVLNYINNLGPSRVSGFADRYDSWSSNVTIAEVAKVSLDTLDSDGVAYISDIPNAGENPITLSFGSGITISIGANSGTALDYIPNDIGIPEIAFLAGGGLAIGRV